MSASNSVKLHLLSAVIVALSSGAAWAQAAAAPTTPAEIQPGHPPPPASGSAAPQAVTPAPLTSGTDTPGGAARNGVIAPPVPNADTAINRGAPSPTVGTPVIPPPGSPGGNPTVIPK